ncbi:unnamed protein product [Candidatus Paraburkholderia kirkii UZHbot1]|uniref:WGS project CAFE00000000 data, contig bkir_c30 n=1 Tax=Candidatus Paraburkholderia kirkii UZHbot1 TaxID=1055526 RepID=U3UAS6_9BURK|nr:unnamed protein product [Candidatus Paraburkholderia kirkii UZHbot1]
MLFDLAILVKHPLHVLGVLVIIILGKSVAALTLVLALRYPLNTALTVSARLAQIGEFSFILAGLGLSLKLLLPEGMNLVLAGALISIALNPVFFAMVEPMRRWILKRSEMAHRFEQRGDPYAELPMDTERRLSGRPGRSGRLPAGREAHLTGAGHARHPSRRSRAESGAGGRSAQARHRRCVWQRR